MKHFKDADPVETNEWREAMGSSWLSREGSGFCRKFPEETSEARRSELNYPASE